MAKKIIKNKETSSSPLSLLLGKISESLDHLGVMDKVGTVLKEIEERAKDVKDEARKELKKVIKRHEGSIGDLEKKVVKVADEIKGKAQVSMIQLLQKWHENKDLLPKGLAGDIENLVIKLGMKTKQAKTTKKTAKKTEEIKKIKKTKAKPSKLKKEKDLA